MKTNGMATSTARHVVQHAPEVCLLSHACKMFCSPLHQLWIDGCPSFHRSWPSASGKGRIRFTVPHALRSATQEKNLQSSGAKHPKYKRPLSRPFILH